MSNIIYLMVSLVIATFCLHVAAPDLAMIANAYHHATYALDVALSN